MPSPAKIFSAIKQIFFFYNYLPPEWRKKAAVIFKKLWDRHVVAVSTDPDVVSLIYNINFDNPEVNGLVDILPEPYSSLMYLGQSMKELTSKGLHAQSEHIKSVAEEKYGSIGLNITHMMLTNDIQYVLSECKGKTKEEKLRIFEFWARDYKNIAFLGSAELLKNKPVFENKIIEIANKNLRDYILVNFAGTIDETLEVIKIIDNLKKQDKLNYKDYSNDLSDSGFKKFLRIKVNFK